MTQGILIKPKLIRQKAQNIRENSKQIHAAIQAVDQAMSRLGPARFEGQSADVIRRRYASIKDKVFNYQPRMAKFATILDETAARFEEADKKI